MASTDPQPTDPGRRPPKRKTFLFVNKDLHSEVLSRSENSSAAATINSHVQRWQGSGRPPRRPKPSLPTTTTATTTVMSSRVPDHKDCVTKVRPKPRKDMNLLPPTPTSLPRSIGSHGSSGRSPDSTEKLSETSEEAIEFLPRHDQPSSRGREDVLQLLTANFSGPDCIDPFRVTSLPLGRDIHLILQYYISFTLVSTFQASSSNKAALRPTAVVEPPHFPAIRSIVTGSLANTIHMYALLAATASRMKRVNGVVFARSGAGAACSPAVLMHNAIRCLRAYFSACSGVEDCISDRQIILDVFYLCVCEWYEESYTDARTHLAFVRHFWGTLRPQESVFDRYVHDVISYNDVFLAIETGKPPVFALTWEPEMLGSGRIEEVRKEIRGRQQQEQHVVFKRDDESEQGIIDTPPLTSPTTPSIPGAGFTSLLQTSPLSLSHYFSSILEDLVPFISIAHLHHGGPHSHPASETRWLSLKTQSLLHRLLSLPPNPTEEPVRLALTILLSCLSTSPAWREGKVSLPRLAGRLRGVLEGEGRARAQTFDVCDAKLRLWVLFTGAFAAAPASGSPQTSELFHWFRDRVVDVAGREGIGMEIPVMRPEFMRYFYLEHLEGEILGKVLEV